MARSSKQTTAVKRRAKPKGTKTKAKSKSRASSRSTARPSRPRPIAVAQSAPQADIQQVADFPQENDISIADYAGVSEEKASIISIVRSLEGQVETAFKLKEILEDELDTTRAKLTEQMGAHAELKAQAHSLEAQATLADRLREDVSYAEQERNKFANLLAETQPKLEQVTEQRDSLLEELTATKHYSQQIEAQKTALEAQVLNLKDKTEDTNRLRDELDQTVKARDDLQELLQKLSDRLEASEKSNHTLESELAAVKDTIGSLREENEGFRENLEHTESRTVDLFAELEQQQSISSDLLEAKTRLESETKMSTANYETAKTEIDALKKALRYIRSEATRTSGRVRQRYQRELE